METTKGEEGENDDGPCAKHTRQIHSQSDFSRAPWALMLRKAELKRRDSRETRDIWRNSLILYDFFLELVKLAKLWKWFSLAAKNVADRQCIAVELKVGRSCCQFCQKRDVVCCVFRSPTALTFGYGCAVYVGVDVGAGDAEVDVIYISFT